MKIRVRSETFSLLAMTSCLLTLGCSKEQQQTAVASIPPPSVSVAAPVEREVTDFDEYTGRITAVELRIFLAVW